MQKPGLFGMNGFLLFLLTCCSFALHAQQAGNLVLIDADNKLPFTVRVGDQLFTSSGHGHLVIAHLKDSSYTLGIRFPKKNLAEQVFLIVVKQKDLGFQLQGNDSVWVLYNWQTKATMHVIKDKDSSRVLNMGTKREDGFSKLMAAVVDDTAVMYNTFTGTWFTPDSTVAVSTGNPGQSGQPLNKLPDSARSKTGQPITNQPAPVLVPASPVVKAPLVKDRQPEKTADSSLAKGGKPLTTTSSTPTAAVKTTKISAAKSSVKKLRDINLKVSRKMVFLDAGADGLIDTVTIFVFFETKDSIKKQSAGALAAKKKQAANDSSATAELQSKTSGADVFIRGCGEQATTADLEWLRSAILKANTEEDKISAASTAFALKCFSVSQLRVLAALFVSDKARYRLMEAAKLHISDRDHFRELADMYTDKNFQKKFLVMADKRS